MRFKTFLSVEWMGSLLVYLDAWYATWFGGTSEVTWVVTQDTMLLRNEIGIGGMGEVSSQNLKSILVSEKTIRSLWDDYIYYNKWYGTCRKPATIYHLQFFIREASWYNIPIRLPGMFVQMTRGWYSPILSKYKLAVEDKKRNAMVDIMNKSNLFSETSAHFKDCPHNHHHHHSTTSIGQSSSCEMHWLPKNYYSGAEVHLAPHDGQIDIIGLLKVFSLLEEMCRDVHIHDCEPNAYSNGTIEDFKLPDDFVASFIDKLNNWKDLDEDPSRQLDGGTYIECAVRMKHSSVRILETKTFDDDEIDHLPNHEDIGIYLLKYQNDTRIKFFKRRKNRCDDSRAHVFFDGAIHQTYAYLADPNHSLVAQVGVMDKVSGCRSFTPHLDELLIVIAPPEETLRLLEDGDRFLSLHASLDPYGLEDTISTHIPITTDIIGAHTADMSVVQDVRLRMGAHHHPQDHMKYSTAAPSITTYMEQTWKSYKEYYDYYCLPHERLGKNGEIIAPKDDHGLGLSESNKYISVEDIIIKTVEYPLDQIGAILWVRYYTISSIEDLSSIQSTIYKYHSHSEKEADHINMIPKLLRTIERVGTQIQSLKNRLENIKYATDYTAGAIHGIDRILFPMFVTVDMKLQIPSMHMDSEHMACYIKRTA
jgi:hypothetical protein